MSGSSKGVSGFIADIAGDVGNSYIDLLLQDSPLQYRHSDIELLDANAPPAGRDAPDAPMVGLDGDILPPDTGPASGFDAIEPGAIDVSYSELQEPQAITGPAAGQPAIEAPDMDGPDIDEPY